MHHSLTECNVNICSRVWIFICAFVSSAHNVLAVNRNSCWRCICLGACVCVCVCVLCAGHMQRQQHYDNRYEEEHRNKMNWNFVFVRFGETFVNLTTTCFEREQWEQCKNWKKVKKTCFGWGTHTYSMLVLLFVFVVFTLLCLEHMLCGLIRGQHHRCVRALVLFLFVPLILCTVCKHLLFAHASTYTFKKRIRRCRRRRRPIHACIHQKQIRRARNTYSNRCTHEFLKKCIHSMVWRRTWFWIHHFYYSLWILTWAKLCA